MPSGLSPAKPAPVISSGSPTILGKRGYEHHNGVDGESRALRLGQPGPLAAHRVCLLSSLPAVHRAWPGNMKKRLLMPSRGKAWGGRWRGPCAVLVLMAVGGLPAASTRRCHADCRMPLPLVAPAPLCAPGLAGLVGLWAPLGGG